MNVLETVVSKYPVTITWFPYVALSLTKTRTWRPTAVSFSLPSARSLHRQTLYIALGKASLPTFS